jgi:hypothetical protein
MKDESKRVGSERMTCIYSQLLRGRYKKRGKKRAGAPGNRISIHSVRQWIEICKVLCITCFYIKVTIRYDAVNSVRYSSYFMSHHI